MKVLFPALVSLALSGCASVSTQKYVLQTGDLSPSPDGKVVTLQPNTDAIERIDETHYKTCSGIKWWGATLSILLIPLPAQIPTGKKCTYYEIQGSSRITFKHEEEIETSYCCGLCPKDLKYADGQFFGCGKW